MSPLTAHGHAERLRMLARDSERRALRLLLDRPKANPASLFVTGAVYAWRESARDLRREALRWDDPDPYWWPEP